jgi:ATP-binding cassette, subfamily C (CFTR/MRP), member 1
MLPEDKEKGDVDFKIFKEYIKLNGGYACFLLPVLGCLISYSAFQTTASIFISIWSDSNGANRTLLYVFIGLTLSATVFIFLQALILTFTGVKQGQRVHSNIIKGLIYANLNKFFNRVPLGRIINRLSKDLK